MQKIYKITGGKGRCACGHKVNASGVYYLIDTENRAWTFCEMCGKQRGLHEWWGAKETLTSEEMQKHWFGAEPIQEVVCRKLTQYTRKSRDYSSKREEMLKSAVEV